MILERWNSLSAYNIAFRSAQHQRATWYLRASVSLPARAGERDARQRQYRPIATSRLGMTLLLPGTSLMLVGIDDSCVIIDESYSCCNASMFRNITTC